MRRVFAIAVVVGLVWAGLTVFMDGTDALRFWTPWSGAPAAATAHPPSALDRIRASGEAARDKQMDRIEHGLRESGEREE